LEVLLEAYRKHETWVDIVKSFGCNPDTAEDLVQEMYLKLHRLIEAGLDIKYNDTVNYFYIHKILRSLFLDLKRKESRVSFVDDDILHNYNPNENDILYNAGLPDEFGYRNIYKEVMQTLEELYWYDRKVYEMLDGEMSVSEQTRNTGISYYSLYNTYKKVKQILIDKLL